MLLVERRVGAVRGAIAHQYGVAIRIGLDHGGGADHAIGATLVVNDNVGFQLLAHVAGHETRQVVVGAARGVG
ncbi:hypothetical protein D3C85_1456110 [compost metagenome]